jgi:hypothetical protein
MIRIRYSEVSTGTVDPHPYQNVSDLEHWHPGIWIRNEVECWIAIKTYGNPQNYIPVLNRKKGKPVNHTMQIDEYK